MRAEMVGAAESAVGRPVARGPARARGPLPQPRGSTSAVLPAYRLCLREGFGRPAGRRCRRCVAGRGRCPDWRARLLAWACASADARSRHSRPRNPRTRRIRRDGRTGRRGSGSRQTRVVRAAGCPWRQTLMASTKRLEPFDWRTMPLDGRALIEASAGTGKTWSIGMLYLRLLLETGLGVERILVTTFTVAAAQEL